MEQLNTPLIEQRADPFIYKQDNRYHFIASVPGYDRLELRSANALDALRNAPPITLWTKPDKGPLSELIWAPELHRHQDVWYLYFAAAPSRQPRDGLFQHRMYVMHNTAEDPAEGHWSAPTQIDTGIDSFCLDATTFTHQDHLYYVWAQKDPAIVGNSNLYIARMETPETLATPPVCLTVPELAWETRGFKVNEGPAVLIRHGRVLITYSASATDENYCMGMLWADQNADLLSPSSWHKSPDPILVSDPARSIFGPGHNSFTVAEDGVTDILVYHARTYTDIEGDPLWDPNRHTFIKPITWDKDGFPKLGQPSLTSRR